MKRKKYIINEIYKFTMRADKQIHGEPMEYRLKIGSTKIGVICLAFLLGNTLSPIKFNMTGNLPTKQL